MSEVWQTDHLGKYCYIKARIGWRGLSASEYTESGPYLIAGKHVENGIIDWDTCDHISEIRYRESWEIALSEGDVILTKDGTIGRVARIDSLPGKATINGTMMLIRPGEGLDYRFLYHVLNGEEFKRLIEDKVSGSSIPHIFQRDMINLPISFPPIEHQVRLAQILDTLDTAIRETEYLIDKLKAIKQGLLHDLLTRGIDANGQLRPPQIEAPQLYKDSPLGWIPREWEVSQLCTQTNLITSGSRGWAAYYAENGALFLRSQNVRMGCLDLTDRQLVKPPPGGEGERTKLEPSDLLITITGNGVGNAAHVPLEWDEPAFVSQHVGLVRFNDPQLALLAAHYFVEGAPGNQQIVSAQYGQSKPGLSLENLRGFWIPVPAESEISVINSKITCAYERLAKEDDLAHQLRSLKLGLMDDLLTGRTRVTPLLESMHQTSAQTGA
jgi:type I restriction enzyme S subunit